MSVQTDTDHDGAAGTRLGPFTLGERLGEGGMAAVYRGIHRQTGVDVAIKVIPPGAGAEALKLFRREVQAHASLVHPHIVYLFDYGEADIQEDQSISRFLDADSPYIAMELARGGTVRDVLPVADWTSVRDVIIQVLDGLAFSHARGVVHLDLKPENLLLFEDGRLKIADFGIAHAMGMASESWTALTGLAGTPFYASPEQLQSRWREYGPWTDIYALGCTVWELVSGRPPFVGEQLMSDVVLPHISAPRPDMQPQFEVPDSLHQWVRTAMAIDPRERFQRAADAARALPGGERGASQYATGEHAPTLARGSVVPTLRTPPPEEPHDYATTIVDDVPAETLPLASTSEPRHDAPSVTEVPPTWRGERPAGPPPTLVGAGLGLFGLREPPFVDRDEHRDLLWDALRVAAEDGRPRVVMLVGEPGSGKSRLAEWLCTRAHEVGAARPLRTVNTEEGGPAEGLRGMVRRLFRGASARRKEFYEHLMERLPPLVDDDPSIESDAAALTELVFPSDERPPMEGVPAYRFTNRAHRHAVVARLLRRFARRRPLVLWLDDAHCNGDDVAFARRLLQVEELLPVLVVMTLRTDVVEAGPMLAKIGTIGRHERVIRSEVSSLETSDQRLLLEQMLPLEPRLAESLAHRTEGNPLFAIQLLGDRVERGQVVAGPDGFVLREGASLDVSDDIHQLWMGRLERLFQTFDAEPERLWEAIHLAGVLGREVDSSEWGIACEMTGVTDLGGRLVDRLVERGLASRAQGSWAFSHALLVDSIRRDARESGVWKKSQLACVRILDRLYGKDSRVEAGRRARHWIAAGEYERALKPLRQEYQRQIYVGDYEAARTVARRSMRVFDTLGVSEEDPRRIEMNINLLGAEFESGMSPDLVLDELSPILQRALDGDHAHLVSKAWRLASFCHRRASQPDQALDAARRAVEAARESDDDGVLAVTLRQLGRAEITQGNTDRARELLRECRRHAAAFGEPFEEAATGVALAALEIATGDDERAREITVEMLPLCRRNGFRYLESSFLSGLGQLERRSGDIARAVARYRSAIEITDEQGHPVGQLVCRLGLLKVQLLARYFDDARSLISEVESLIDRRGPPRYRAENRAARLACEAGCGEWVRFDETLSELTRPGGAGPVSRLELFLELAEKFAREHGESERASRVRALHDRLTESD